MNFVSLDFETATAKRHSPCELGLTWVRDGRVSDTRAWLIQPPDNHYDLFNSELHGIIADFTSSAPTFAALWPEVKELIGSSVIVAHNASFDRSVLNNSLTHHQLLDTGIDNSWICTYKLAKHLIPGLPNYQLSTLCEALGINAHLHHRASGDSQAAAQLLLELMKVGQLNTIDELLSLNRPATPLSSINTDADADNFFYGKSVCFTGEMNISRSSAIELVRDRGADTTTSVSKLTSVIVVGNYDRHTLSPDYMSSKMKKAAELIASGHEIEIISEAQFLQLI
jgi:DNA polymerase III subunit epsilon